MGHLLTANQQIRAVAAQIQADWTAYQLKIELDNRDAIDQGAQTDPYLQLSIIPMGGGQADLGESPLVEQRGQILLCAVSRGGTGADDGTELLEFAMSYFDMAQLGLVRCHAATATEPKDYRGWRYAPAIIEYWYHRTSN